MRLTYVGPFDAVEVDGVGVVKHGDTIDVPAERAGRAPDPRLRAAHDELHQAISALDHNRAKALREEIVDLDAGAGLLAQPENWVEAKTKKTPAAAGDTGGDGQ